MHTHTRLDVSSCSTSSFSCSPLSSPCQHIRGEGGGGQPSNRQLENKGLPLLHPHLLTLPSESKRSRLLCEPLTCLQSSDAAAVLPPDMLTPAAHHSCKTGETVYSRVEGFRGMKQSGGGAQWWHLHGNVFLLQGSQVHRHWKVHLVLHRSPVSSLAGCERVSNSNMQQTARNVISTIHLEASFIPILHSQTICSRR